MNKNDYDDGWLRSQVDAIRQPPFVNKFYVEGWLCVILRYQTYNPPDMIEYVPMSDPSDMDK